MNMLVNNFDASTAQEIRENAVLDVAAFIRREGLGIFELLELVEDDDGAEAVLNLIGLCTAPLPDHGAVAAEMAEVVAAFECITLLKFDDIVAVGAAPFDIYGAVRWFGPRVADLSARMKASRVA